MYMSPRTNIVFDIMKHSTSTPLGLTLCYIMKHSTRTNIVFDGVDYLQNGGPRGVDTQDKHRGGSCLGFHTQYSLIWTQIVGGAF